MRSITLGLDFGTTNTVVSRRVGSDVATLQFNTKLGLLDTVRTVLAFWQDPLKPEPSRAVGRDALAEFSDFPDDTRLIQSIKSYAANPLFRQSMILNRSYTFSQIMREFIEQLFRLSDIDLSQVRQDHHRATSEICRLFARRKISAQPLRRSLHRPRHSPHRIRL